MLRYTLLYLTPLDVYLSTAGMNYSKCSAGISLTDEVLNIAVNFLIFVFVWQ